MRKLWVGVLGAALAVALLSLVGLAAGCGEDTGVCTGCCGPAGQTYCKDDWTESECADWNQQGVNGVTWVFHEGQTCAGRGTPATP